MSTRNTVSASILSAFALVTLCLLPILVTAQKGPNVTSIAKASQLSLTNTTLATMTVPVPGAPLKGVDVKLGRNPGGGAAARTLHTDNDGKIDLSDLAAGSYWMEVVPLTDAQRAANWYPVGQRPQQGSKAENTVIGQKPQANSKAANADDADNNYLVVTITGTRLVGKTKTRSLDVNKWKFVNARPKDATARTADTYADRIEFEIGPATGGHPPVPVGIAIIRSKSNITNN